MGDLNAESPKNFFNKNGHGIGDFLTDLQHILHARSCIHCLWFPHARRPPRPLKRPQN